MEHQGYWCSCRGGKAAEVPVDTVCNNLCYFEALAERKKKKGRENGIIFQSYQLSFYNVHRHGRLDIRQRKLRRAWRVLGGLAEQVGFHSCLLKMHRGQDKSVLRIVVRSSDTNLKL